MSIRLYIPPLGDVITLAEDWTFTLYPESRNWDLATHFGMDIEKWYDTRKWSEDEGDYVYPNVPEVTIPTGAQLKIDRIYIRKGQKDFDSVTFLWKGTQIGGGVREYVDRNGQRQTYKIPRTTVRFWAKLPDVNKLVIVGE